MAFWLFGAAHTMAVIEIAPLSSAELEARYRLLIEELRCPKCQNQNLSDSDSPIAADLREQIRVLLEDGKSDEEVVAYLVDRYGDFVRYRPAVQTNTLVLWFAPAAFVVLALIAVLLVVRGHQRAKNRTMALSLEEQRRLDSLLSSPSKSGDEHL
ncbi:MAG: cytochrome c-type biogenesis protein [Porticoccaceae bacterium]